MPDLPPGVEPRIIWEDEFVRRVQFIGLFLMDPCEAPFDVYLRLAVDPLVNMVLAMIEPNPEELTENLIEPQFARDCRRGRKRRGRRGRRSPTGKKAKTATQRAAARIKKAVRQSGRNIFRPPGFLPDVDSMITNRISRGVTVFDPVASVQGRAFWSIFNFFERANFTLFFWNEFTKFLHDWFSALMQTEECQMSTTPRCRMSQGFGKTAGTDDWAILPLTGSKLAFGACSIDIGSVNFFTKGFHLAASLKIVNPTNSFDPVSIRLRGIWPGGGAVAAEQTLVVPPQGSETWAGDISIPRAGQVVIETIMVPNQFHFWTDNLIVAQGTP